MLPGEFLKEEMYSERTKMIARAGSLGPPARSSGNGTYATILHKWLDQFAPLFISSPPYTCCPNLLPF